MRRSLRLAAAATALGLTITACGSTAPEVSADGGGLGTAENPVSIRVIANDAFAKQWQDQLVPEFNKKYPNIKVSVDGVPYNDQLPKTMLELTGPTATYDVVLGDDSWIPQLAKTGGLMDLKADVTKWTDPGYDWADFNPSPLAAGEWEGKQYAVPVRSNLLLMLYNKTLYKKAGVKEPTAETTWEQYFKDAEKLVQDTDGDGKTDAWAVGTYFTKDPLTPTIWQTVLNSNGVALLDDNLKVAFDNETGVKALQTHVDLLKYAPPGASTYQFNEPLEAFRQGRTATMFMWGSVYKGSAVDKASTTLTPEEVGVTTLPAGSAGPGAHRGIWSAGVAKKSQHPAAAWTWLQWVTSKEGEKFTGSAFGTFPARNSSLDGTPPAEWAAPVYKALKDGYTVVDKNKMWRPRLPESDAVQQILALQTSRAMSGQATAEQAIDQAAKDVTELLKSKGYQQ
ncbi:carbohydrate ABC transporter substrate-binding protein, CUT1 family [Streptosporangium canum]|uniref:Carbohydrate ABC transporter substrate-binding protein, CUT1 family n=1 Tax=Streptosporangium canum TaxID=324952 RepID=A0A1I4D972_9ACTN|nr:sugar ABC transporter substrate-binding protein [Streptosporangium canum]SFK90032.1 carbohydrate ABC transporter substrate-binding protein, CUT1 family [Streptosporangium canum]